MKTSKTIKMASLLTAMGVAVTGTNALANIDLGTFTTSGSSPSDSKPIAASASFVDLGGGQLQVTLVNTYSGATFGIGDTIYGLYFAGASGLSLASAVAPTGSTIWNAGTIPTSQVLSAPQSILWAYDTGLGSGVTALTGGNQSDGLVSAGFTGNFSSDGLANANHNPFVQNEAIFTFNYTGSISSISSVKFLYGTDINSNDTATGVVTSVPETSTVIAGLLLVLPLGASTIRILRQNRVA